MKNMNKNKIWAVAALAAVVVVGGAWAVNGNVLGVGEPLAAAVLKASPKPPVFPPAKPNKGVATATPAAVAPTPVATEKQLCAAGILQKACEENALKAVIATCKAAKTKCSVVVTYTSTGQIASMTRGK